MENILSFSDNFHKTYNSDINYSLQFKDQLDIEIIDHNLPVHLCTCGKKPHLIIYRDEYRRQKDRFSNEQIRFQLKCPHCNLIGDRPNLNTTIEFWNKMFKLRTLYNQKLKNGELLDELKDVSEFIVTLDDWCKSYSGPENEYEKYREMVKRNFMDYPSNIFFPDEELWNEYIDEQNESEDALDEDVQNTLNDLDIANLLNITIDENTKTHMSYQAQNMKLILPYQCNCINNNYNDRFINQTGVIENHNLPLCLCTCGNTAKLHIKKIWPRYIDYEYKLYCPECNLYSKDTELNDLIGYWNDMFLLRHEYQDKLMNKELDKIIDFSLVDPFHSHISKKSNIYFPNKELWEKYSIPNNVVTFKQQ